MKSERECEGRSGHVGSSGAEVWQIYPMGMLMNCYGGIVIQIGEKQTAQGLEGPEPTRKTGGWGTRKTKATAKPERFVDEVAGSF